MWPNLPLPEVRLAGLVTAPAAGPSPLPPPERAWTGGRSWTGDGQIWVPVRAAEDGSVPTGDAPVPPPCTEFQATTVLDERSMASLVLLATVTPRPRPTSWNTC